MTLAGLIFTNINEKAIPEMTRSRTVASIPFGGRYRLIDFALSNLVNSGADSVGVVTGLNYQSLTDHIGNGKDWDLARRSGGIKFFPPMAVGDRTEIYGTRMDAFRSVEQYVRHCGADYLILTDCDSVCNIDFRRVVSYHNAHEAGVTLITRKIRKEELSSYREPILVNSSADGKITAMQREPMRASDIAAFGENEVNISTNMMVMSREYAANLLSDAALNGYHSFYRDVFLRELDQGKMVAYPFDGLYESFSSLAVYFACSMRLLTPETRTELFGNPASPILTKVRNTAPTCYAEGAEVHNSMIADGCVIEGKVENSILFRGVHVGKGAVVRNAILLQNTRVENNVSLNCVVSDKDVTLSKGITLSGHEKMPFYIAKGTEI